MAETYEQKMLKLRESEPHVSTTTQLGSQKTPRMPTKAEYMEGFEPYVEPEEPEAPTTAQIIDPEKMSELQQFLEAMLTEEGDTGDIDEGDTGEGDTGDTGDIDEGDTGEPDISYDYSRVSQILEEVMDPSSAPQISRFNYIVNESGLELSPSAGPVYDDPQAIADAADDHAAKYIYKDIPGEAVPDAASLDMAREHGDNLTYQGDGPGGDGMIFFYEDPGGGNQRGYWYRNDASTVNVTNILFPPSGI